MKTREEKAQYDRAWYQKNKESRKAYYQRNRERFREESRIRAAKSIDERDRYRHSKLGKTKALLRAAKQRAISREFEYDLTEVWLYSKFKEQRDCCALTGIPLEFASNKVHSSRKNPYFPSLDRIDCTKGYTQENTRLVCTCVNLALNDFGIDIFKSMCVEFVEFNEISKR